MAQAHAIEYASSAFRTGLVGRRFVLRIAAAAHATRLLAQQLPRCQTSQVYGMVHQFSGEMKITSQLVHGTTISLYFPVSDKPLQDSVPPASDKVLVVNDQPDALDMPTEMLSTLGFHVVTASSGRQALEILGSTQDIHLPFTDGSGQE